MLAAKVALTDYGLPMGAFLLWPVTELVQKWFFKDGCRVKPAMKEPLTTRSRNNKRTPFSPKEMWVWVAPSAPLYPDALHPSICCANQKLVLVCGAHHNQRCLLT